MWNWIKMSLRCICSASWSFGSKYSTNTMRIYKMFELFLKNLPFILCWWLCCKNWMALRFSIYVSDFIVSNIICVIKLLIYGQLCVKNSTTLYVSNSKLFDPCDFIAHGTKNYKCSANINSGSNSNKLIKELSTCWWSIYVLKLLLL